MSDGNNFVKLFVMGKSVLARINPVLLVFVLAAGSGVFYSLTRKSEDRGIVSPIVFGTIVEGKESNKDFNFFGRLLGKTFSLEKIPVVGKVLGERIVRLNPGEFKSSEPNRPSPTPTSTPTLNVADAVSDANPTATPTLTPTPSPSPTPAPSGNSDGTLPTPTPTPVPGQSDVINASETIVDWLVSNDNKKFSYIYTLMGSEFKSVFSESDFVDSLSSAPDVAAGALAGAPNLYGGNPPEWGEQVVSLTLTDGSVKKFLLILHRENENSFWKWKLYGTEEKP